MTRRFPWLLLISFAAIPFVAAGRIDLPFLWAVTAAHAVVLIYRARNIDPDLLQERLRPGPGGVDRRLRAAAAPLMIAQMVVGGMDVGRFHWSDGVPPALQAVGVLGVAAGLLLASTAMSCNRFFSPVVRIQTERGHTLVDTGPYAWVRHPGYAGSMLWLPGWSLAIGSWWSLAPAAGVAVLILRRAIIEDRYLHEHLPGYREYAQRVRWRMLPGVW